jgi:uncharacterized Ntn-hydrolase superfamily protein
MTFSLVARCRETGMFGVAVASSSPAVAARCAYARAGVGAVASQNVTDPSLGPLTLDLMQAAMSAEAAIAEIKRRGKFIDYRQLLAVDQRGRTAIHSGRNSLGVWAEARAEDIASGGNLLANDRVPQAVVDGFLASSGHLRDARWVGCRRRGWPDPFGGPRDRGSRELANRRFALRLDAGLPDRGDRNALGHL